MNDALYAWTAAGYAAELVPVCGYQHDDCGSPGKVPHSPGWQTKEFDLADFAPGMNLGQRTRYFPAIDIDVEDAEIVAAVEDVARELLGTTARRSRSNSPRCALLYKLEGETFKKASVNFTTRDGRPAKIEILGDGQQLVGWSTDTTLACISRDTRDEFISAVSGALEAAGCTLIQTRSSPTVSATPPPQTASVPRQSDDRRLRRASAYLAKIPGAVWGDRGSPRTLVAAEHMVLGFELSEEDAFDLLWTEYNPRCDPPWSEKEMRRKVREAATKGTAVRRGQREGELVELRHGLALREGRLAAGRARGRILGVLLRERTPVAAALQLLEKRGREGALALAAVLAVARGPGSLAVEGGLPQTWRLRRIHGRSVHLPA